MKATSNKQPKTLWSPLHVKPIDLNYFGYIYIYIYILGTPQKKTQHESTYIITWIRFRFADAAPLISHLIDAQHSMDLPGNHGTTAQ